MSTLPLSAGGPPLPVLQSRSLNLVSYFLADGPGRPACVCISHEHAARACRRIFPVRWRPPFVRLRPACASLSAGAQRVRVARIAAARRAKLPHALAASNGSGPDRLREPCAAAAGGARALHPKSSSSSERHGRLGSAWVDRALGPDRPLPRGLRRPCAAAGSRGWRVADSWTGGIVEFPGESAATNLPGSAQGLGPV